MRERKTDWGSVAVVRFISWNIGLLTLAPRRISARPAYPKTIDFTSENPSLRLHALACKSAIAISPKTADVCLPAERSPCNLIHIPSPLNLRALKN